MNETTNWREIDVSTPEGLRALDWEIAKRQGWKLSFGDHVDGVSHKGTAAIFSSPDGDTIILWWEDGQPLPIPRGVPTNTTDLNLSWALITDNGGAQLTQLDWRSKTDFNARCVGVDGTRHLHGAPTPALACCFAFLERDDARIASAEHDA